MRAARPFEPDPRDDPRAASNVRDQEGGAGRRHALPARVGGGAGDAWADHAARDQQGDLRRMNRLTAFFATPPPPVGAETSATRIAAVPPPPDEGPALGTGLAVEPLAPGAVVP